MIVGLELIERHGWVFMMGSFWAYCIRWRLRVVRRGLADAAFRRLIRTILLAGSIPWLIMGAGLESDRALLLFDFLKPSRSPFVTAFFLVAYGELCAMAAWVLLGRGANTLAKYPGWSGTEIVQPGAVRLFVSFFLTVALAGLTMLALGGIK